MDEQKQISIKAKDEELKGRYSNMMQISHTKEEFVLDFFLVFPPEGQLASRVIMNPGHVKRMVAALQENIKKYEEKFGKLEESEYPEPKLGFSVDKN